MDVLLNDRSASNGINTPILVIGFNRPDKVRDLLSRLQVLNARNVFVSLDGPRNEKEKQVCLETRMVVEAFKGAFDIHLITREQNLGCCLAVTSALDWFFTENLVGIILEDDCVPADSMLTTLQSKLPLVLDQDSGIGMVTAHNPLRISGHDHVSRYFLIQGWGTSARVWNLVREQYFSLTLPQFTKFSRRQRSISESMFWWANSSRARLGGVDTWDGIFSDRMWRLGFNNWVPSHNLIENSGFDSRATHTTDPSGSIFVKTEYPLNANFDEVLKKDYFHIKKRHSLTSVFKVLADLILQRSKSYEEILESDRANRSHYFFSL